MHQDDMTRLEKLDWVHWYLSEIHKICHQYETLIDRTNTLTAIKFIEDVRDSYIQDYK